MELGVWKLGLNQSHTPCKRQVFHVANLKGQHRAGSLEAGTQSIAYSAQKMSLSCGKSERSTQSWEFGSWYSVNERCVFQATNLKGQHGAGSLEAGTQSMAYAAQKRSLSCGKSERSTQSWEFGSWYSVNGICVFQAANLKGQH